MKRPVLLPTCTALMSLLLLAVAAPAPASAADGEMRWGLHVTLHNGEPVTAEDVKFSFDRYKGASNALLKDKVKEVQVLGPNQVRFVLKEPWGDFMTFYGTTASGAARVVPKKYVQQVGEEPYATKHGIYAYGSLPEVDDLFVRQGREPDPKKREALVGQIQKTLHDQVTTIPVHELAFIRGVGPRVEESGANLIPGFAYSAPMEDLKLKVR